MSTKYANNPTANLFELLQVDSDLPQEKRTSNKTGQATKKQADAPTLETPAEKGARRKAEQAQKAAAAAAEKQRQQAEEQMAGEGFQVQKGSGQKKPAGEKPKALKREDFESAEKPPKSDKPAFRGPGNPKKFEGTGKPEGAKQYRGDGDKRQPNPNRQPKHEGFDKHSGGKTTNKPPPKRQGGGTGNWGNQTQTAWPEDAAPSTTDGQGWGDEGDKKVAAAPAQDDSKPEKTENTAEAGEQKDENRKPAWDDEGYGKVLLDEFQKTTAAERAQKLASLGVGVKGPGRQIENTVDLSKCSYRDTTDEKEKKLAEERKNQLAEERKKKGQQRADKGNVDLSEFIAVKSRGGRGGRGGGRGGDRPPRAEGSPDSTPEGTRPNRGRGGRGTGGGGNRVPQSKNAFPELSAPAATVVKTATPPAATGSPKSTK